MSVIIEDKKASMKLSNKLFKERKTIFVIKGSITSEITSAATKAIMDTMNMKATYALKDIGIPAFLRLFWSSSNAGRKRSILLPNKV